MRDVNDNAVIVCSIENFDPMGVHTGDSITVAPAQTLTDREYQTMRDASIAILREIGVETGGSQRAVRGQPGQRPHDRHRDEPARVALLGARLQGDRLPDRQDRGQARRGLHARRDRQRHHARDAGVLRAEHRLHRGQGAALGVREVPRHRRDAHHAHEVGGRGDGDRPHLRGGARQGVPLARERPRRPGQRRQGQLRRAQVRRAPRHPQREPALLRRRGVPPRPQRRRHLRAHAHRPVVPAPHRDDGRRRERAARPHARHARRRRAARSQAHGPLRRADRAPHRRDRGERARGAQGARRAGRPSSRSTPAPPSSRRTRRTTTRPTRTRTRSPRPTSPRR